MADLASDDTPNAFCSHPDLPLVAAEILCLKHCFYLSPNDSRYPSEWVAKLARLNASVAANTLARLGASDIAGRIADELNRRNN